MKKIVVEKISITRLREKVQFQVTIPENAVKLTGVDVTNDLNMIVGGIAKRAHRGIGILRLHIADQDDCFFSQMLHQDFSIPKHEQIGKVSPVVELWSEIIKPYEPFPAQELTEGTIICGYYEDLVGYLKGTPTAYHITLTLHYQVH
jgi:hypothetical protein